MTSLKSRPIERSGKKRTIPSEMKRRRASGTRLREIYMTPRRNRDAWRDTRPF